MDALRPKLRDAEKNRSRLQDLDAVKSGKAGVREVLEKKAVAYQTGAKVDWDAAARCY